MHRQVSNFKRAVPSAWSSLPPHTCTSIPTPADVHRPANYLFPSPPGTRSCVSLLLFPYFLSTLFPWPSALLVLFCLSIILLDGHSSQSLALCQAHDGSPANVCGGEGEWRELKGRRPEQQPESSFVLVIMLFSEWASCLLRVELRLLEKTTRGKLICI